MQMNLAEMPFDMDTVSDDVFPVEARQKIKFTGRPLTEEQRVALKLSQYYRPYQVNHQTAVKGRRAYWIVKRIFDVVCATGALIVLSPLILVVMVAIYIEDPHASPIFKQERVGRDGKTFQFLKLRSMCCDAEEKLAALLLH